MRTTPISGAATLAGVVGHPISHSLSPLLHNTWIMAAGLDAMYAPFRVAPARFDAFIDGLRGGVVKGLNVTLPFKQAALAMADEVDADARAAGAANILLFHENGLVEARNTDGEGMLYALSRQASHLALKARPVVVIGAGGAARGALAALCAEGVDDIRVINRTKSSAEALARDFQGVSAWALDETRSSLRDAHILINATSAEVSGGVLGLDLADAPSDAVAMDMLYRPLRTPFLRQANARGLQVVDGLDMLIGQAQPSFTAFFGESPPTAVDPRALLVAALEDNP